MHGIAARGCGYENEIGGDMSDTDAHYRYGMESMALNIIDRIMAKNQTGQERLEKIDVVIQEWRKYYPEEDKS